MALSDTDKAARVCEIFQPYHDRIAAELDRRRQAGLPAALIALHSFTPVFKGEARPWHVALLYHRDPSLSRRLIALLKQEAGLIVGDNEPYQVSDTTDYTIPTHGERRGLPHALIEIRQDLIADEAGQRAWADRLARLLPQASVTRGRPYAIPSRRKTGTFTKSRTTAKTAAAASVAAIIQGRQRRHGESADGQGRGDQDIGGGRSDQPDSSDATTTDAGARGWCRSSPDCRTR